MSGYTADGLRAWKTLGGGPTFFYYDGGLPVLETDDGGNLQAVNTWGPNGLLSRRTGSTSTFYTFDLQGSVTQRLSSAGGVLDTHLFDAYGTELSTKAVGDPFGFGAQWGYYTDQANGNDTGMVLCGWRYYDPTTGRFLTRDPIGYAGGLNLYAFAGNNPVSFADPDGTNPLLCGAVGAGIGAIVSGTVAYVHHQDIRTAIIHGAVVGGVSGFFTCLGAPELGEGFLAGLASGATGGAIGDASGQVTAMAFGWQPCFSWSEVLASSALGGTIEGLTNVLGGAGGAAAEAGGCFVAGTPLTMDDGTTKPIESVRKGDWVLSRDPATGKTAAKRVTHTFMREVGATLMLTFADGQQVETTAHHPFNVKGSGFVAAGRLPPGALILTRVGSAVRLARTEVKAGPATVYNLEVEGFHSYFVGTGPHALWVYNAPCSPPGFTRVGRWMSQQEHDLMVASGRVQPTRGGLELKSVSVPPAPGSYLAADPGSVFVEFDVPTEQLARGGKSGWGIVYGPDSIHGRLAAKRGLALLPGMPEARNIVITGRK